MGKGQIGTTRTFASVSCLSCSSRIFLWNANLDLKSTLLVLKVLHLVNNSKKLLLITPILQVKIIFFFVSSRWCDGKQCALGLESDDVISRTSPASSNSLDGANHPAPYALVILFTNGTIDLVLTFFRGEALNIKRDAVLERVL